jgi:MFS family permease
MTNDSPGLGRRTATAGAAMVGRVAGAGSRALTDALGGAERTRIILLLASVLALSSADASTVGASATQLRDAFDIGNTEIGLLVTVTSLVGAVATLPFGVVADRGPRTWILGAVIVLWGAAMIWSAFVQSFGHLLVTRLALGAVTAAAGPLVASLVGDYFDASERGRIWGFILGGELVGVGIGFGITGDLAALSWRLAFVVLALPAFALAWLVFRLPEPERGARDTLASQSGTVTTGDNAAQKVARDRGVEPDPELVLTKDPRRLGLIGAVRYVLRIRTNVVLIVASACGYFFLAGVQTFGVEFATNQYGIAHVLATLLLLVVVGGGVLGMLAGGALGDLLLHRGYLNGRILVSAITAAAAVVFFVPALVTQSAMSALPWLVLAAFSLSAQNPPLDAARLDIMVPLLWGRAEGVRTFLRTSGQALAPLLFGAVSEYVFGGGHHGLRWTFAVMLLPLAASAYYLFTGMRTYPRDVATAAASASGAANAETGTRRRSVRSPAPQDSP